MIIYDYMNKKECCENKKENIRIFFDSKGRKLNNKAFIKTINAFFYLKKWSSS